MAILPSWRVGLLFLVVKTPLVLIQGMNKFIPRGSNRFSKRKKNFQPFNTNFISTRDKGILKEYKKIRNSVKKETIKLTQQEQHRISMECKKI